jgi:hypothetical protein
MVSASVFKAFAGASSVGPGQTRTGTLARGVSKAGSVIQAKSQGTRRGREDVNDR